MKSLLRNLKFGLANFKFQLSRYHRILLFCTISIFLTLAPNLSPALQGKVNINTATVKELKELPFIGSERAKAIVRYRKQNGPFISLSELKSIPAIGLSTFAAIEPYLTISARTDLSSPASPDNLGSFRVSPRIHTSPGEIVMLPNSAYYDTLLAYIRNARHSIHMTMFIFKTTTSPKNRPALIVQELIKARNNGVSVHVILEESGYDEGINMENKKVARKLKKNGIKVRMDSAKRTTHAKIVVIDSQFSFVGSHNMTHSALTLNNEFSLLVNSGNLAEELSQYMKGIQ